MHEIISTTCPNSQGEMLWCVHYKSSYYDDDPRMPGNVPIDHRVYVLAKNRDEALAKVGDKFAKSIAMSDEKAEREIMATIVFIEDLIPARKRGMSDDYPGRISFCKFDTIGLSCEEDTVRYRLGVCLIPIK